MEYICPFENNQEFSGSGCESGWTLYLGHSSVSPQALSNQEHDFFGARRNRVYDDEEEDEDLSMVSDASSGPPHLNEEDSYGSTGKDNINGGCFYSYENINESALSGKNLKRQKIEENRRRIKVNEDRSSSLLDDTASSPFFGFSNERFTHTISRQPPSMEKELEYSQGYSTTHFDARAHNYHETYEIFQSPASGNQLYQNQWFEGKRW